jgi:hypothetical protein
MWNISVEDRNGLFEGIQVKIKKHEVSENLSELLIFDLKNAKYYLCFICRISGSQSRCL